MSKPSPMGSTFAERAAAAAGKDSFKAPEVVLGEEGQQSTFAERAKAAEKSSSKAVDSDGAEDKAVAKKSVAKKS